MHFLQAITIRQFILLLFTLGPLVMNGQNGKDGTRIINAPNTVVNDYTALTSDANAGNTSIQVANNNLSSGFTSSLSTGDLIFIIQVQGASIITADDPTYGTIQSYQNCGHYEFAEVAAIAGTNQISLVCPLTYGYSTAGRTEVVRVPRYTSLTVNGGAGITCPAWNGSTGGIVAIEVWGQTIINGGGTIDASGKGFRGGALINNNSSYGVGNHRWPGNNYGAEKGEGIAGNQTDYDLLGGRYCRGAPANGGGGGNAHNGGGGGGANAGNVATYTGNGTPDNSNASWASAWNLESAGFAASVSSGGGKGGYTFSSSNQNALVTGPGNSAWGGDSRNNNGGLGGRPLDYSTGRIFMGGGGGAGEENNSKGGAGGNGGGIVMMLTYANITGSGQILCDGANGGSTTTSSGTDGSGGGGGGGTVILNTSGSVNGVTINARGGNGGSQTVSIFIAETEGPGGGGGGGYIAISSGAPTRNVSGGVNGTTNSSSLNEFPPNGATKGGVGTGNATVNAFNIITQSVNLCSTSSATLTFTTQGTPPPGTVYTWYDQPAGGSALGTGNTFTTPALTSSTTYYVGVCPGTLRVPVQVNISSLPVVSFTNTVVCAGSPTAFTPGGSSSISSWNWDFGDGSANSIAQNPQHTYPGGGNYTVTLTASDGVCSSSISQSVSVSNSPVALFTSSAAPCGTLNIQFTNNSSGASGYSWNFGDGSPANTQANPVHLYPAAGMYTVVLTAQGAACSGSQSVSVNIGVAPRASFSAINSVCQNDTVHFTNLSNGNGQTINSWTWNFGDGTPASNSANPNHAYGAPGVYSVTLTAATATCTDDTTITINVSTGPLASFSTATASGCSPLSVSFSNNTTGGAVYDWDFGDGSAHASLASPVHTYGLQGTYTVTLIAAQGSCRDTLVIPNYIQVSNSPTSSFSASGNVCLGDTMSFTNTTVLNGAATVNYVWDFGDGGPTSSVVNPVHLYTAPGTFVVRLTAANAQCSDDTTITVTVSNSPAVSFTAPDTAACGPLTVNFNNTTTGSATYRWDFGDGSGYSALTNPSHLYSQSGFYTVTLIATQGSCADTLTRTNYIQVTAPPHSSVAFTNVCEGDSVRFVSTSTGGPINTYAWTYGDGTTGSGSSTAHLYTLPGTYSVALTVDAAGCADDTTVSVTVFPVPVVGFSPSLTHACDSATVSFNNASSGALTYLWTFGDGGVSGTPNPSHHYAQPGIYSVTLEAISSSGCATTRTRLNLVTIHETPSATVNSSSQSICSNECVNVSGQSAGTITTWQWTFAGANPSAASVQNPGAVCYPAAGNFDIVLNVSNGFCSSSTTHTSYIHVADCSVPPVAAFISADTVLCNNACIDFVDLSTNAVTWNWSFPGATPASSSSEHPAGVCYSAPGSYSVTLIVGNASGRDTISYTNLIQVMPAPAQPVISQSGNTLNSSPAFHYQWYFNGIPLSGADAQTYVATLPGWYSVVTTDVNGCTAVSAAQQISLVGIEQMEPPLLFYIYPNPVTTDFTVIFSSPKPSNLTIDLLDATGRMVYSGHFKMSEPEEKFRIDPAKMAAGFYFLRIRNESREWVRPLIKQ